MYGVANFICILGFIVFSAIILTIDNINNKLMLECKRESLSKGYPSYSYTEGICYGKNKDKAVILYENR